MEETSDQISRIELNPEVVPIIPARKLIELIVACSGQTMNCVSKVCYAGERFFSEDYRQKELRSANGKEKIIHDHEEDYTYEEQNGGVTRGYQIETDSIKLFIETKKVLSYDTRMEIEEKVSGLKILIDSHGKLEFLASNNLATQVAGEVQRIEKNS